MSTNILIVGGIGRDHAIAWKLSQSKNIGKIFLAPGSGGTAGVATNVNIAVDAHEDIISFAKSNAIDIVYVSGDAELGAGLVDLCQSAGLNAFGPNKAAAQIESSKAFSKEFMRTHNIPTAAFEVFSDYNHALEYLQSQTAPIVVKASGLAGGKGAIVCRTMREAEVALKNIMSENVFGTAGEQVVIEEFMEGPEISIHVFSDGTNYSIFPPAQDHKAALEGNKGANTGGMGTIAPLPNVSEKLMQEIKSTIVEPVISGLRAMGNPFIGVLYPGIMLTKQGPKVLEYNARLGDPETQSYLRLLESDLLEIIESCLNGTLNEININWSHKSAVNIVLASGGYPEAYEKGKIITGLVDAQTDSDIVVFHAGTKIDTFGNIITDGGRVLGVSAIGDNLDDALFKAYKAVDKINFEGKSFRKDIGKAHNNARLKEY